MLLYTLAPAVRQTPERAAAISSLYATQWGKLTSEHFTAAPVTLRWAIKRISYGVYYSFVGPPLRRTMVTITAAPAAMIAAMPPISTHNTTATPLVS
jgi:hypothetical protein